MDTLLTLAITERSTPKTSLDVSARWRRMSTNPPQGILATAESGLAFNFWLEFFTLGGRANVWRRYSQDIETIGARCGSNS